jgi:hypothetical protein
MQAWTGSATGCSTMRGARVAGAGVGTGSMSRGTAAGAGVGSGVITAAGGGFSRADFPVVGAAGNGRFVGAGVAACGVVPDGAGATGEAVVFLFSVARWSLVSDARCSLPAAQAVSVKIATASSPV